MYKNSEIDRELLERCKSQDPSGHEFFIDTSPQDDKLDSEDDDIFLKISKNIQEMNIDEDSHVLHSDDALENIDEEYQEQGCGAGAGTGTGAGGAGKIFWCRYRCRYQLFRIGIGKEIFEKF